MVLRKQRSSWFAFSDTHNDLRFAVSLLSGESFLSLGRQRLLFNQHSGR